MLRCLLLVLLAAPLHADLRIVTRHTFGTNVDTQIEYFKGGLSRWDANRASYIFDRAQNRFVTLIPAKHEYYLQPALRGAIMVVEKSHAVVVEINTRETGEEKQQWGHTARHFTTTRRQRVEDAATGNTPWQEATIDSWFLDVPVPPNYRETSAAYGTTFALAGNNRRPDVRVTRTGPKPKGILIYEKTGQSELEVTDLSEAALDPKLFEVPPDYRRVITRQPGQQLTWDEQVLYYWQQVENWFENLFS